MSPALPEAVQGLRPLRVVAVQAESIAGDVVANVAVASHWVKEAARESAHLVVLPELFLSGYDPETLRLRAADCDVRLGDERLRPLQRAAQDHRTAVLVGASVCASDHARALGLLSVTQAGEVSLAYAKQHLWREERTIFAPGTDGASVELHDWQIGLGICYDGCFPEHARAASDAGALAYVCPSAYVVGSEHRRDLYYAARALDNAIYVVIAGLVGRCGSLDFSGGTAIYDPQGRPIARVESGTGMAIGDLDVESIAAARAINPYGEDRPPSLGGRRISVLDAPATTGKIRP